MEGKLLSTATRHVVTTNGIRLELAQATRNLTTAIGAVHDDDKRLAVALLRPLGDSLKRFEEALAAIDEDLASIYRAQIDDGPRDVASEEASR
tara:strand:+ start:11570 stop:11848 length:279 start_codon:yes stop_codon:yes gene_type:complete